MLPENETKRDELFKVKCLNFLGFPVCPENLKEVEYFEGDLAREIRRAFEDQLCNEDRGYSKVHILGGDSLSDSLHISRFAEYIDTDLMVKDMRRLGEIELVEDGMDTLWLLNPKSGCYLKDQEEVDSWREV